MRGTDHPEAYPPVARQIMAPTPMFTTVSTRRSQASVGRRALTALVPKGDYYKARQALRAV